jgi:hypothetical protein
MTLPRVPLIVTLLLLVAAAPEVSPTVPVPATTPALSSETAPAAPSTTTAPGTPRASSVAKLPSSVEVQTFSPQDAMPVLGHRVVEPDGEAVARLVDVLVDPSGKPVAAVLDFGGFMGVGNRKIAVHWGSLHFEPGEASHRIILTLTPDEFKAAPEYKDPEKPAPVVVPAAAGPKTGQQ